MNGIDLWDVTSPMNERVTLCHQVQVLKRKRLADELSKTDTWEYPKQTRILAAVPSSSALTLGWTSLAENRLVLPQIDPGIGSTV